MIMEEKIMGQQVQPEVVDGGVGETTTKGLIAEAYNPAEYISRNLKSGFGEGDKKVEKDKEADLAMRMAGM